MLSEARGMGQYIHVDRHPGAKILFSISNDKEKSTARATLSAINTITTRLSTSSTAQGITQLATCKRIATKIYQGYENKYQKLNLIQKLFVWLFGSRGEVTAYYIAIQGTTLNNIPQAGEIQGEYKEKDDGNCAFLTLARKTAFNGSLVIDQRALDAAAQALRGETVAWIRDNFMRDEGLSSRLSQSIYEHYTAKADHISDYIQALENPLVKEIEIQGDLADRIQLEKAKEESLRVMASNAFDTLKLDRILEDYLVEMSQPATFAGAAELYAVGKKYNLLIYTYRPRDSSQGKPEAVRDSLNVLEQDDLRDGYGEIYMLRRGAHYNSYYPHRP